MIERVYQGTGQADYPKTARWNGTSTPASSSSASSAQMLWCGVLAAGADAPRTQPLVGGRVVARESVPGWSDAQHLAVFDSVGGRARPGPWASLVSYPDLQAESPPWAEGLMGARIRVYGTPRDPGHGLFVGRFYLQQDEGFARGDLILRFPGFYDEAWYQQGPMRRDAEANLDQQLQRRSSRFWLLLASAVNGRFTPFRTTVVIGSDTQR